MPPANATRLLFRPQPAIPGTVPLDVRHVEANAHRSCAESCVRMAGEFSIGYERLDAEERGPEPSEEMFPRRHLEPWVREDGELDSYAIALTLLDSPQEYVVFFASDHVHNALPLIPEGTEAERLVARLAVDPRLFVMEWDYISEPTIWLKKFVEGRAEHPGEPTNGVPAIVSFQTQLDPPGNKLQYLMVTGVDHQYGIRANNPRLPKPRGKDQAFDAALFDCGWTLAGHDLMVLFPSRQKARQYLFDIFQEALHRRFIRDAPPPEPLILRSAGQFFRGDEEAHRLIQGYRDLMVEMDAPAFADIYQDLLQKIAQT